MKCTYCNEEHPEDYRFCPLTGKEIMQPSKACTNPECIDFDKNILPSKALFCPKCGQKIEKIEAVVETYDFEDLHVKICDDNMCCPDCGSNDVWRYFGDDDEYVCRDCERSWKGTMESQMSYGTIMKFMPIINGITLGRTTVEDAENVFDEDDIDKDEDGSVTVYTSEEGVFYKDPGSYFFNHYSMNYPQLIPCMLEANGFNWGYDPDYYIQLFKSLRFDVYKSERISVMHLTAFSPDESVRFEMRFGNSYHPKRKMTELYGIDIYSNPYDNADKRRRKDEYYDKV